MFSSVRLLKTCVNLFFSHDLFIVHATIVLKYPKLVFLKLCHKKMFLILYGRFLKVAGTNIHSI